MAIVMFAISVTVYEIFAVEISMTLTMAFIIGQGYMPIESKCRTFYLMVKVMFSLHVTVCEIFAVEICITLAFTMCQDQMIQWVKIKCKCVNQKPT